MNTRQGTDTAYRARHAGIYRKAAWLVEAGRVRDAIPGACSAIADACYPKLATLEAYERVKGSRVIRDFEELFKPDESWGMYWGHQWPEGEQQDCRCLALCFMAAMAEAGDV